MSTSCSSSTTTMLRSLLRLYLVYKFFIDCSRQTHSPLATKLYKGRNRQCHCSATGYDIEDCQFSSWWYVFLHNSDDFLWSTVHRRTSYQDPVHYYILSNHSRLILPNGFHANAGSHEMPNNGMSSSLVLHCLWHSLVSPNNSLILANHLGGYLTSATIICAPVFKHKDSTIFLVAA